MLKFNTFFMNKYLVSAVLAFCVMILSGCTAPTALLVREPAYKKAGDELYKFPDAFKGRWKLLADRDGEELKIKALFADIKSSETDPEYVFDMTLSAENADGTFEKSYPVKLWGRKLGDKVFLFAMLEPEDALGESPSIIRLINLGIVYPLQYILEIELKDDRMTAALLTLYEWSKEHPNEAAKGFDFIDERILVFPEKNIFLQALEKGQYKIVDSYVLEKVKPE